jgi:Tol biopolymer transport system component
VIHLRRKERNRRISAAVIGIAVAILSLASLTWVLRSAGRPADEPPPPKPSGIFSEVGGWIVYGDQQGIWAVDPSHPGDRESRVQLSSNEGIPLAWSSDGSELLISREFWVLLSRRQLRHGDRLPASQRGLFVLHADGTETHLVREEVSGASFSPDGTTVIFAPSLELERTHLDPGIYSIDAEGGVPRLLVEPGRRYIPEQDRSFRTGLYFPTFSPDGTKIAYFDGFGDNSHSLRVVNADGDDLHVLIDNMEAYRITNLVWSPDGKTLAFGRRINDGVYTIGVDGSGLTLVIPDGVNPHLSLDGSRISYDRERTDESRRDLYIADRDGTHVQHFRFGFAASGPWNPLVQPEPGVAEALAASEGLTLTSTLLLVVDLFALVAVAVLVRRRMQKHPSAAVIR